MRIALVGTLAAAVLLSLPIVPAQGPTDYEMEVEIGELPGPIKPDRESTRIPVTVILRFPAGHACSELIEVHADLAGPPYASVVVNPVTHKFMLSETAVPFSSGAGAEVRLTTDLLISVTRLAPAYEIGEYTLTISVDPPDSASCTVTGNAAITQPFLLVNDYFATIEALPEHTVLKAGPNDEVRYLIDLTNFGNGPTRISAEATHRSNNHVDAIVSPPPVVLESKATEGQQAANHETVFVLVQAPGAAGYRNSIHSFQVDFLAGHAGTKSPEGSAQDTDRMSVFLSLQVQGVAAGEAPGSGLVAFSLALSGALVWRARRQRLEP